MWAAQNNFLSRKQKLGLKEDELKEYKTVIKITIEKFLVRELSSFLNFGLAEATLQAVGK
jgi:hypothetical protein